MMKWSAGGGHDSTQIVISSLNPINFKQFFIRYSDENWGRIVFSEEMFVQKTLLRLSMLNMNVHIIEEYNFSTTWKMI